jgi:hypothetical protein
VQLWAEDEHRLGLLPVARRVWAPRGQRPAARVRRAYRWLYVYGFVRPSTGRTWWCLLPTVRAEAFALALAEFARDEGIDGEHRAVVVLDNAGWHAAADLDELEGALVDRCRVLARQRRRIKTRTRYRWWPTERRARKPR